MENQLLKIKALVLMTATLSLYGCASFSFKVVTDPDQAEVFIVDSGTNEPKTLGMTPLNKSGEELDEHLKGQNHPGGLVNIIIKKDGFKTKDIWVPVQAAGSLGAEIVLKLDPSDQEVEMRTAKELVDGLFLSQQFANTKQFERALIEIDKVLAAYPQFDRALSMKAAIHYARGEFEESLKWYESALAVNPELKTAVDMAGKVRETLKTPTRVPTSNNKSSVGGR